MEKYIIYPENVLELDINNKFKVLRMMLLFMEDGVVKTTNGFNDLVAGKLGIKENGVSKIVMGLRDEGFIERVSKGEYLIHKDLFKK